MFYIRVVGEAPTITILQAPSFGNGHTPMCTYIRENMCYYPCLFSCQMEVWNKVSPHAPYFYDHITTSRCQFKIQRDENIESIIKPRSTQRSIGMPPHTKMLVRKTSACVTNVDSGERYKPIIKYTHAGKVLIASLMSRCGEIANDLLRPAHAGV